MLRTAIGIFLALCVVATLAWWALTPLPAPVVQRVPWRNLVKDMQFRACDQSDGATFVIAPHGLDDLPCTVICPCRTFLHTMEKMNGADTLYVRGGHYNLAREALLFRREAAP